jgi:hypothetical protein
VTWANPQALIEIVHSELTNNKFSIGKSEILKHPFAGSSGPKNEIPRFRGSKSVAFPPALPDKDGRHWAWIN